MSKYEKVQRMRECLKRKKEIKEREREREFERAQRQRESFKREIERRGEVFFQVAFGVNKNCSRNSFFDLFLIVPPPHVLEANTKKNLSKKKLLKSVGVVGPIQHHP